MNDPGVPRGEPAPHDPEETAAAFTAARAVCRRHARSFYFASRFLPKPKRDAAYAVYAFCRMIDDAVDAGDDAIERAAPAPSPAITTAGIARASSDPGLDEYPATDVLAHRLALFDARLTDIYTGGLDLPAPAARTPAQHALRAFAVTVHAYAIPKQYFLDLAEGCRMDLTVARYDTWADLERYCYHVAGVVGLIMSCVFGLSDPAARANAVQMGNAMQLTNILRDVGEDWRKGRVYLPREDLDRFGYREDDLGRGTVDDRFVGLMRFEVARARDLYRRGAAGLCCLADDGSRLTAAAMAVVYAGILGAIERQGYDVFHRRAHLTTLGKLARVPAAIRLARRGPGRAVPDVF